MKLGISGHQNLGNVEHIAWINNQIRLVISDVDLTQGISSLAEGADQLFAQAVLDNGKALAVVVPCANYEETFKELTVHQKYIDLLTRAATIKTLPYESPNEDAFYAAGCDIVDLADVMVFVWDGKPAQGLGGTADIVKYAIKCDKSYIHINPLLFATVKSA